MHVVVAPAMFATELVYGASEPITGAPGLPVLHAIGSLGVGPWDVIWYFLTVESAPVSPVAFVISVESPWPTSFDWPQNAMMRRCLRRTSVSPPFRYRLIRSM